MGNPDLTGASPAEAIRAGDPDAIAAFYDRNAPRVKAYCEELCAPDLVADAASAAFVDFLARIADETVGDDQVEALLLKATRSAAAGRAAVASPEPGCRSVPELLAARANGELPGDDAALREHLQDCRVCADTVARIERAEWAFLGPGPARAPAPDAPAPVDAPPPVAEARPVPVAEPPAPVAEPPAPVAEPPAPVAEPPTRVAEAPAPVAEPPAPVAEPPAPSLPEPVVVRRRTGGLLGAVRDLARRSRRA